MTSIRPAKCRAKFLHKVQVSRDVYEFSFQMIDPVELNFISGQYISIEIDPRTRRQYSISISPLESKKLIKIIVDVRPNGLGVNYLMCLEVGNDISFIGQIGLFVLPESLANDLYFVATNTGLGPLKSMIETIINDSSLGNHNIYLYYGTRYKDGIIYRDVFNKYNLEGKIAGYKVTLSKDTEEGCDIGHVTQYIEPLEPSIIETSQFFLCGSGSMIETVSNLLRKKGFKNESISFEKFY